jgi:SacI restriction endonuclease
MAAKKLKVLSEAADLAIVDIEKLEVLWSNLRNSYQMVLLDERVSRLVRSKFVAHRFALVTQLAGGHFNPNRNFLALQTGAEISGSWDPRSYASSVIVPWLRNHRSPLGDSGDPYVSNPLRRTTISPAPDGVKKSTLPLWKDLHDLLQVAQVDRDKGTLFLHQAVSILMRLVDEQDAPLVVPDQIPPQVVVQIVEQFLSEPSGGDRALAITTAIFEVMLAPLLKIVRVERSAVNASDQSTDAAGDIMCFDEDDSLMIAVEVKERSLNFEDVRSALSKFKDTHFGRYVFAAPVVEKVDRESVEDAAVNEFRKRGRSCHFVDVEGLLKACLLMHDDKINGAFLRQVDQLLTKYNTQPANRTAWRDLVHDMS